jgi:hypothetical protein
MSVIAIKKPDVGTIVRSETDKFTGKVIRILDYKIATGWMDRQTLLDFNKEMEGRLGEDFRDSYFEAYIKIDESLEGSRYQENQIIHLAWDEIQDLEFVAWESKE